MRPPGNGDTAVPPHFHGTDLEAKRAQTSEAVPDLAMLEESRPASSCSSVTRSPTVTSVTFKIANVATNEKATVTPARTACFPTSARLAAAPAALMAKLANAPVSRTPMIPPTMCTPTTSSESS